MLKPLKEMDNKELESNYDVIVKWTIARENPKTEKAKKEWDVGLRRVEEYEDELRERGYNPPQIHKLYAVAVFSGTLGCSVEQ